jgi:phosphoribosylamine--glycine ligase
VKGLVKVLLVGDASREHAIADAFARSNHEPRLYAAMSRRNPGIARLCKQTGGDVALGNIDDPSFVVRAALDFHVDFVFVGPEEPLFHGIPDALEEAGVPCVGAKRQMALIEMSKAFMRRLMWKYKIPGRLRFKAFKSLEDAIAYVNEYAESVAIKPARQAGGKGVKVIADLQVYLSKEKREVKAEHVKTVYEKHMAVYDDIDDKVLIEERVEGPEYTLQTFTDGRTVLPLPAVQDNKNAYEMDIGPETGGMGSIAGPGWLLPFLTEEEYRQSVEVIRSVVEALWKETGVRYKGVVSGQMMLTALWGTHDNRVLQQIRRPRSVQRAPIHGGGHGRDIGGDNRREVEHYQDRIPGSSHSGQGRRSQRLSRPQRAGQGPPGLNRRGGDQEEGVQGLLRLCREDAGRKARHGGLQDSRDSGSLRPRYRRLAR